MARHKESSSGLLILILGIVVGFAAAAFLCFLGPTIPADAQGVGFFGTAATGTRTSCSQITNPVQGQTVCFEQSENLWKRWTGLQWAMTPINVVAGGLPTGEVLVLYGGDGSNGPFIVASDSSVLLGNQITSGMTAPGVGLSNSRYVYGLNFGGTSHIPLIGLSNIDTVTIATSATATTVGGKFLVGFATSNLGNVGQIQMLNNTSLVGLNFAADGVIPIASINTSNHIGFDPNGTGSTFNGHVFIGATTATNNNANNLGALTVATALNLNATRTLWVGDDPRGTPRCTDKCGNAPILSGHNSSMRVTMGATGVPASPFLVLFNGTWTSIPSCIAQQNTASGATVTVSNATTTGVQVNTWINPAQGSVFSIHCHGAG
jgi:hypothetical protein